MDVLTSVENRVRDGVRSHGIDPLSDPDAARELVDAAVANLLMGRSDGGAAGEAQALARQAFSAVAGFGPLQQYFDDPDIEELWIKERLTQGLKASPDRSGRLARVARISSATDRLR